MPDLFKGRTSSAENRLIAINHWDIAISRHQSKLMRAVNYVRWWASRLWQDIWEED